MKFFSVIFLFILLFSFKSGVSQDTSKAGNCWQGALKKGNYAIIFEAGRILGNSNFFEEYTLTAKKHISDNFALRFGAGGNIKDETGETSSGNGEMIYSQDRTYSFVATFNFQYFLSGGSKIKPFISAGPYGEYSYNLYLSGSHKIEEWGAGIFASFGVEMFILENVSLIGEYIFKATAGKRYSKYFDPYINAGDYSYTTVYKVNFKTARLGFSVYF